MLIHAHHAPHLVVGDKTLALRIPDYVDHIRAAGPVAFPLQPLPHQPVPRALEVHAEGQLLALVFAEDHHGIEAEVVSGSLGVAAHAHPLVGAILSGIVTIIQVIRVFSPGQTIRRDGHARGIDAHFVMVATKEHPVSPRGRIRQDESGDGARGLPLAEALLHRIGVVFLERVGRGADLIIGVHIPIVDGQDFAGVQAVHSGFLCGDEKCWIYWTLS